MSLNQLCTVNENALTNLNIGCHDLQVTCTNGDLLSLKPPNHGTQGQLLVSKGDGSYEFKTISAGGGTSNYYLYRKDSSITVPPSQTGKLNFNNTNQQLSTHIYINHRDELKTDIDFYLELIIPSDFIYIQDRTNSTNWIKFLVVSTIVYPNNYIDITVSFVSGEGTGLIDFGSNHEIFWSTLTNTPAIQNRLSSLEDKTQYQSTPTLNQTNFSGTILADTIIKSSGTNTEYMMADGSVISGLYNITSDGSGETIIADGLSTTFKLKDLIAGQNITLNPNASNITINSITTQSTLSTDGIGDTLVDPSSGFPSFKIKSLLAGTNIGLASSNTDIIITNNSPASLITLNNSGAGSSIINTTLTSNPNLYLKSLSSGTGISLLDTTNNILLTNSSPASSINLSYSGAGNSLISSSTNPNFKIKGLIQSTGITIVPSPEDLTISADLSSVVLKAGDTMTGQLTLPAIVINTGTVINSVPYINSNLQLVSNQSNLYCQSGLDNLQTIVNNLVQNQGNSIQLSSGTHTIASVTLTGQDYYILGASSSLFTNSSIISGNMIFGNQSFLSTRIRVSNIRVNGNLTFVNDSIFQGLNYSFSNCDFKGASIQFPTSSVSGNFINFFDCTFNQNFTIQNTTSPINFTRCNFNGFNITNNLVNSQYLTFENSIGLPSLSIGNCTLYGMNKTFLHVSQLTSNQLKLSGTSSQYVLGDGSFSSSAPSSNTSDNYRYTSWGYIVAGTVSTIEALSTIMTNIGGSLTAQNIDSATQPKGLKFRNRSNVSSTANGATCGWLGTSTLNYIYPKAGWVIKIGFSLDALVNTASGNRTMIGLFQSTTRPTLDNTITITSVTTGSMGIVQEKGETVFSFNTRGTTASTKITSSIPCDTPNNNWYTLTMINDPSSSIITLILTCQTPTSLLTDTTSFTCGLSDTMPITTSYIHLQQSMASAGGVTNSAFLTLGNISMRLAQ